MIFGEPLNEKFAELNERCINYVESILFKIKKYDALGRAFLLHGALVFNSAVALSSIGCGLF